MALICASEPRSMPGGISPRTQIALMTCACAGASAFVFAVDPNRHAVYPQCLLHNATGLYCAGCGATRALYALLHGRVLEALHDNALFVGALPFLIGWGAIYLVETWRRNAWQMLELKPGPVAKRAAGIFLVMVVFMVARNLPGWPFALLRPLG